ncbi:hypothetical protein EH223_04600 [candidate division KSB1 bacterium]|nr:MAG: hypothetical protein EH223_04600 [candidate division KSB1 bacterium]
MHFFVDIVQQLYRRDKRFSLDELQRIFTHHIHQRLGGSRRMVCVNRGIRPQGVLCCQADFLPGFTRQQHGCLPDLLHIAALEAKGTNERFAFKSGLDVCNRN